MTHSAHSSGGSRHIADGYEDWWFADRRVWWRDFDIFGHLAATSYGIVLQDVFGDLVAEKWGDAVPAFVASRMDIEYRHEVVMTDNPVRVHVRVTRVGRVGFDVDFVLRAARGQVCAVAHGAFAGWDLDHRRSRPLTASEKEALWTINDQPQEANDE